MTVLRELHSLPHLPVLERGPAGAKKVVVVDVETDGLTPGEHKIIQVAARQVWLDQDDKIIGVGKSYVGFEDPGRLLTAEITRLTNITQDDVAGKAIDYLALWDVLDGAAVVIAHNAAFDRKFWDIRFPMMQELLCWACSIEDIDWRGLHGLPSSALKCIAWGLGYDFDAHRADADVDALIGILSLCPATGMMTYMQELMGSARRPRFELSAVGAPFHMKDALKAANYKWDPDAKVWRLTVVGQENLDAAVKQVRMMGVTNPVWRRIEYKERFK